MNTWWLLLSIPLTFLLLSFVLRRTGGYAPGWVLRCTSCGHSADASAAGVVRLGATSKSKRTLGHCSRCGSLRWLSVERHVATSPAEDGGRA